MKITFLGHAGFLLEGKKEVVIDPFLTGNPLATVKPEDIKADLVLLTHGHSDHLGDGLSIAAQSQATVVSVFEMALYCLRQGVKAHGMHIGGGHAFDNVHVKLTTALHGTGLGGENEPAEYLGLACGFIIKMDQFTIYHSGDTGLFGDMELIGKRNAIDLAMLPIGDNFTMGPEDALEAVKMLKPKRVIPMHFNTFPLIQQDPLQFKRQVEDATEAKVLVMNPGEHMIL